MWGTGVAQLDSTGHRPCTSPTPTHVVRFHVLRIIATGGIRQVDLPIAAARPGGCWPVRIGRCAAARTSLHAGSPVLRVSVHALLNCSNASEVRIMQLGSTGALSASSRPARTWFRHRAALQPQRPERMRSSEARRRMSARHGWSSMEPESLAFASCQNCQLSTSIGLTESIEFDCARQEHPLRYSH